MRLPAVCCILLACIATMLTAEKARPKRDLQFIKDVIAAKLGITPPKPVLKEEDVKILRIPGFERVLVRATPKVTVVEEAVPQRIVQVDPTMAIVGSYLGTKTQEETLFALQGMKQLLQSGVLSTKEFIELSPSKAPAYVWPPPMQQKVNCPESRPIYPVFENTMVPMSPPVLPMMPFFPPLPVLPPVMPPSPAKLIPVPPKIIVEEFRPVPMPPLVRVPLPPPVVSLPPPPRLTMPVVPTRYSYRKVNTDGSVASYLSEGKQDVIITETNKPLPPPPAFILDRMQKIVYGKLGSPVLLTETAPTTTPIGGIVAGPIFSKPLLPNVDIKISHSDRKNEENTVPSKPVAIDVPVGFLAMPPPPVTVETPKSEEPGQVSYKHVHSDGTISTYDGTLVTREPPESDHLKHITMLAPSPPVHIPTKEFVTGEAHKPKTWGYSLKMSNGVGSYETLNGDQIHYSRLEDPANSDVLVLPDPLSSVTSDESKRPNNNMYELDQYGNPLISTKINGAKSTAAHLEFEKIKKTPPIPTPIAGENPKMVYSNTDEAAKYSYKVVHNSPDETKNTFSTDTPLTRPQEITKNNNYQGFGSAGFSYTQVNYDGTVDTFTGTEKQTKPAVIPALHAPIVEKKIPALLTPIVEAPKPIVKPPPIIINVGEEHNSGFSYTQLNKEGSVTTISGDKTVNEPMLIADAVPIQPAAIVDIIQPLQKGPCKAHKNCKKQSSKYSYTQINNGGSVTTITGDGQVKTPVVYDAVEVPVAPEPIVEVQPQSVQVEVGKKKSSEVVVFDKPMWPNYVYKQISHTNPKQLTVVKIGNKPEISPVAEVHVKVTKHENARPCNKNVQCKQVQKVVPNVPAPLISTVPNDFIYLPPFNANAPLHNSHNVEFVSSTQSSSGSIASSTEVAQQDASSSDRPTSFSLNPIVVEDLKYSYKQKQSDGSSFTVQGDKNNNVSVTVDGENKTTDSGRGDIPEASS